MTYTIIIFGGEMFKPLLFITLIMILAACASTPEPSPTFSMSEDQYTEVAENYSDHTQKYNGPYNVLEVNATLMNSHVIEAQTLRQASIFQWNQPKYQKALEEKQTISKDKTEVFISFFTPDKKSGDLTRTNTLWTILLKVDGKEYAGTPKKLSALPVEINGLYPNHNRWSNPYIVTFDVPVSQIEKMTSELVLTGPVGSASLTFQAIK